ncbi:hypothetical protein [Pseudoduganella lutea]|uniref:WG repeat-containing protein n=1 Tax=Pseudoduganella lutea TaxID=321985 RepID=A0A4P6L0H3_9BURK|nr:hypothetical protein [Pseudoduganella lutea]QBE64946.1 hypothetical protein EWM63_19725 [Pseudoduganella lutea]
MKGAVLTVLFLLLQLATVAHAFDQCPRAGHDSEWSARCFEGEGKDRRIKPEYLDRVTWNRHGMATILVETPRELLAVNRQGQVVVPNIRHSGDFDFPNGNNDRGRFEIDDGTGAMKCGYFVAERFDVIARPEYDHCQGYRNDEALACKGCIRYCTDQDCHDSMLIGGQGIVLGLAGNIKRRFDLPTLDQACAMGKASLYSLGSITVLQCTPAADSPFKF